jgi:serine/threonine protein kinase
VGFAFVCDLNGVYRSSDETFVVTSFCTEGDLFAWCDRENVPRPGVDREKQMLPIVTQIFTAVRWLHELGIAHRDLSLENILLTDPGGGELHVKVIDFGMATLNQTVRREVRGKQSYQAPEMHTEAEYDTFLADAFAIGVVLFAMAAQDYPWTCTKRNACQLFEYVSMFGLRRFLEKRKLRKGNGEYLIDVFSPAFTEVVEAMLQTQPRQRACFGEHCLSEQVTGKARRNIWEMKWLENASTMGLSLPILSSPQKPIAPTDGSSRIAGG